MSFDVNKSLLINYVPLISTGVLFIITLTTVIYKLRNRWPIKVNCWFCAHDLMIPRQLIDWWQCIYCEQYNGFSKDGDYKFKIPEQYRVNISKCNKNSFCKRRNFSKQGNQLCFECTENEEFKFLKLRELENSDLYNEKEIEQFYKTFEIKYPLCSKCQIMVDNVLKNQSIWLAQYKMLFFRNKPIKYIIKNKERIEKIIRILLLILASVAAYYSEVPILPVLGVLLQFLVYLISPDKQISADILPIIGWIVLIGIKETPSQNLLNTFELYSNSNYEVYKYFVTFLVLIIGLANWNFHKFHSHFKNSTVTFKKLGSIHNFSNSSDDSVISKATELFSAEEFKNNTISIPFTKTVPNNSSSKNYKCMSRSFGAKSSSVQDFGCFNDSIPNKNLSPGNNSYLNESLSSLHSLSLGTSIEVPNEKSPKVFETKVYNSRIPDLFYKSKPASKRSFLAAPKLKSLSNSSLASSGYWQIGLELPSLSRSSSQSSGLGSIGSNFGQSKEPSVCDFDQCSVSEEINNKFIRPDTPALHTSSSLTKRSTVSSFCTNEIDGNTKLGFQEKGKNSNKESKISFSKPIWLSILLGISIVINIVVLFIKLS